jgi:hypothetical protein
VDSYIEQWFLASVTITAASIPHVSKIKLVYVHEIIHYCGGSSNHTFILSKYWTGYFKEKLKDLGDKALQIEKQMRKLLSHVIIERKERNNV